MNGTKTVIGMYVKIFEKLIEIFVEFGIWLIQLYVIIISAIADT